MGVSPLFFSCLLERPLAIRQLLNLRSNFRFNTLWLGAFYYGNPLFLMGVSILIYAFLFTPLSQVCD